MSKPQIVKIGDQEFELQRITARRGLKAASLILPHLAPLRPTLEAILGRQDNERVGLSAIMDGLQVLAPVLDPDTFLEIGECVTGIPRETLAEAPLEDVFAATVKGLAQLDLAAILKAASSLFGQQLAPVAEET